MRFVIFGALLTAACGGAPPAPASLPAPAEISVALVAAPRHDDHERTAAVYFLATEIERANRDLEPSADEICERARQLCRLAADLGGLTWAEHQCRVARSACTALRPPRTALGPRSCPGCDRPDRDRYWVFCGTWRTR